MSLSLLSMTGSFRQVSLYLTVYIIWPVWIYLSNVGKPFYIGHQHSNGRIVQLDFVINCDGKIMPGYREC